MKIEWTLKRRIKAEKRGKLKTTYFGGKSTYIGAKSIGYSAANLSENEEKQLVERLQKANEEYLDIYIKKIRGLYLHKTVVEFIRSK